MVVDVIVCLIFSRCTMVGAGNRDVNKMKLSSELHPTDVHGRHPSEIAPPFWIPHGVSYARFIADRGLSNCLESRILYMSMVRPRFFDRPLSCPPLTGYLLMADLHNTTSFLPLPYTSHPVHHYPILPPPHTHTSPPPPLPIFPLLFRGSLEFLRHL